MSRSYHCRLAISAEIYKTYSTTNAAKTKYFYYLSSNRISSRENGTCPNTKHYPAETLELLVKDTLVDAFREESWIDFVNDTCDQRLRDLRKMHRSNPLKARERPSKRIDALGRKETRLKDLYVDGDISKEEYGKRKTILDEDVAQVTDELSKLDDLDGEIQRIDQLRHALLSIENPLSGHYCFTESMVGLDNEMMDNGLGYGSRETAARRRQEFYRQAGLRVKVGEELEISLGVDGISVSADESASGNIHSPTGTP